MLRFILVAALWVFSLPAFCQTIVFKNTKAKVTFQANLLWDNDLGPIIGPTIEISGEINRDTVILVHQYYELLAEFEEKIAERMNWKPSPSVVGFELNSVGGDVDAAIEIGRFLRSKEAFAAVADQDRCASACLFILAGAVTRMVSGSLGIDRPFLETPSDIMTTADAKRGTNQKQDQLRAYFREMNIPERLGDDMMMIPSTQMKWLSPQEIAVYELGMDDPVVKQTRILSAAKKYGLSQMEYQARWRRIQEMCGITSESDCQEKIMTAPR